MSAILKAQAYANNLVAFIAWRVAKPIPGCLGFEITRLYADGTERILAAWVPFKNQANPKNAPQDTSVWPVQKFSWRDLTVRLGRDGTTVRDGEVKLRYRIRPLVKKADGLEAVPVVLPKMYDGTPLLLSYFDEGFTTEPVKVTQFFGELQATFTNGILSSQGLATRLEKMAGHRLTTAEQSALLTAHMSKPADPLRERLAGDVLELMRSLFARADAINGTIRLALYELKDAELISLLIAKPARVEVILSTAGSNSAGVWDTTNTHSRQALINAGVKVFHRLFNNSARIGHNKFAVLRDANQKPVAVLTGSTNWTPTGLCGQSNNASLIGRAKIAAQFQAQWDALLADTQQLAVQGNPGTFGAPNSNVQGPVFRTLNAAALPPVTLKTGKAVLWFSPNTKRTTKGSEAPPDLQAVYKLMRQAHQAILFACFQPSQAGKTSIISEAIEIGQKDRSLLVFGSVSDRSAMPVSPETRDRNADGKISADEQANTFRDKNVQVVLATALGVKDLVGAFERAELLTTGKAIIHDKIVVIDPLSETNCAVVFGSHNLGYKASYCNDENLVIIRGHRDFALAYAVHVIDLWEHYRFRAVQVERREQGKKTFDGFLQREDGWQKQSLSSDRNMLAAYFADGIP
ncbi:MAG: hypothetical protein QOE70_287 [Chthoniobacter sp.]|jgi:phosphatidylserine/phosphatidylglycerophosphate/cardiolipin synthase-like enzyme|nr:hypothetical protein [Chthoniobacter sp.]